MMDRRTFIGSVASGVLAAPLSAFAKQAKAYRVGVILEGGPYYAAVDGLKDGLKELGFTEGKQYVLAIGDLRGDRRAAEAAARSLEREKVDLIYSIGTSVTTVAKRATTEVPIVFAVGEDPVIAGLADSFAKPGGRLTGVFNQSASIEAKRLQILKLVLPDLHRVVTFYDPSSAPAVASAKSSREAANQLRVEIVERQVASTEELRRGFEALQPREVDAYYHTLDGMVLSQAQFIIDMAKTKRLPTMFTYPDLVKQGALVGYGVSFGEVGRLSAKYVQRILTGTNPRSLPVESVSRVELVVNLKTAREIGVIIPQEVRLRADKIIE
jgi:putative tryptophan/tyrosine transport system substrate-binding protein